MALRKTLKGLAARYASRWRSTRHVEAHLRFPRMDFHEALPRVTYRRIFGVWPDLDQPRTIAEKMCWLKVHDRRAINAEVTDKWRMRGYATRLGLGHLLNDVLAVWDRVEDVDFAALPDAFALKVSNGSAWNIIKRPDAPIDEAAALAKLRRWMATRMSDHKGEWYYDASSPRILAEAYLDNGGGDIPDYKFFVFNGEVRSIQYCEGRFTHLQSVFMDRDWVKQPFTYAAFEPFAGSPARPETLDAMIDAAERLSQGFPLIRADFYVCRGRPILGEISLNPVGGVYGFQATGLEHDHRRLAGPAGTAVARPRSADEGHHQQHGVSRQRDHRGDVVQGFRHGRSLRHDYEFADCDCPTMIPDRYLRVNAPRQPHTPPCIAGACPYISRQPFDASRSGAWPGGREG